MAVTFSPVLPTPLDEATNGVWGDDIVDALNLLNNGNLYKLKQADATGITSSTTVADDTGASPLTGLTLGIGTWLITAHFLATGNASGDIKIAWAHSGTFTGWRGGQGPSAGVSSVLTGATAGQRTAAASDTAATITGGAIYATDGTNMTSIMEFGALVVTVSGVFKIQWAQGTSNGAATTLKAGSWIHARQVG